MAVSSLNRFTVPVASDQSATTQGLLMPKLQYRFRVMFENFGITTPRTELTKQVIDFTKPTVTFEEVPLHVYNSIIKIHGKPNWDGVTVTLRDDALGTVSRLVGEQLQRQFDFFEQSSAASGIDYKFLTRYEALDGGNGIHNPVVLETWELYGCYIESANYNQNAYNSSEPMTITMTLKFDNALQKPDGDGVGAPVPRLAGVTATG